jgi:glutamate 5-kinase
VDAGAADALRNGKSLLPAGVVSVTGQFGRGDTVSVMYQGAEMARGLVAYQSSEAQMIAGRRSSEIETLLGYVGREEIIHRDDLVVTAQRSSE